ncbi:MAG: hypothetical protein SGILL_008856, partial [Bacillariaceae sp.]
WQSVQSRPFPTSHGPFNLTRKAPRIGQQPSQSATAPCASESDKAKSKPGHARSFFHVSYLDLRRQQNTAFADQKATEATQASLLEHAKAETLFKQALNLVPDHVPSLLGYGKLLIKMGRLQHAQRCLDDILEVEPNHRIALQYKKVIERTFKQQQQQRLGNASADGGSLLSTGKKRKDLQMRESSAFQDALLERNLAMEGATENDGQGTTERTMSDDSDSYGSEEEDRRRRKRRRHKKDRKRKKKKEKKRRKKDRRRRYDSASSASSRSASAS